MKNRLLIILLLLAALLLLTGCGVVGYENKVKAVYDTDELKVTLEKYGATQQEKNAGLDIQVINDPNGLLVLKYHTDTREYAATSHKPDETILAAAKVVEAFPVDFWNSLIKASEAWIETRQKPPDPNSG